MKKRLPKISIIILFFINISIAYPYQNMVTLILLLALPIYKVGKVLLVKNEEMKGGYVFKKGTRSIDVSNLFFAIVLTLVFTRNAFSNLIIPLFWFFVLFDVFDYFVISKKWPNAVIIYKDEMIIREKIKITKKNLKSVIKINIEESLVRFFFNDSLYITLFKLDFGSINFNKMITLVIDKSNLDIDTKKKLREQL